MPHVPLENPPRRYRYKCCHPNYSVAPLQRCSALTARSSISSPEQALQDCSICLPLVLSCPVRPCQVLSSGRLAKGPRAPHPPATVPRTTQVLYNRQLRIIGLPLPLQAAPPQPPPQHEGIGRGSWQALARSQVTMWHDWTGVRRPIKARPSALDPVLRSAGLLASLRSYRCLQTSSENLAYLLKHRRGYRGSY